MSVPFHLIPVASGSLAKDSVTGVFGGDTLLVPAVSIGSVPQLTFDLLVHAQDFGLERIAHVDATAWTLPFAAPLDLVGPSNTSSPQGICTAIEIYRNSSKRLTLLHQRSPILKHQKDAFLEALHSWIQQERFVQVLVIGSMDAGMRIDSEMDTPLVHVVSSTGAAAAAPPTDANLFSFVTSKTPAFSPKQMQQNNAGATGIPPLPGAGLTRKILSTGVKAAQATPTAALLMFCAEGDNRGDAHALAGFLSKGVGVQSSKEFQEPRSWSGLFGTKYDQVLFG